MLKSFSLQRCFWTLLCLLGFSLAAMPYQRASARTTSLDEELQAVLRQAGFTGRIESTLDQRLGRRLAPRLADLDVAGVRVPEREEVTAGLDGRSPALQGALAMIEEARAGFDLTRKNRGPGYAVVARYVYRGSLPPMATAGVGIAFPLYKGRKQAEAVAEADARLLSQQRAAEANGRDPQLGPYRPGLPSGRQQCRCLRPDLSPVYAAISDRGEPFEEIARLQNELDAMEGERGRDRGH